MLGQLYLFRRTSWRTISFNNNAIPRVRNQNMSTTLSPALGNNFACSSQEPPFVSRRIRRCEQDYISPHFRSERRNIHATSKICQKSSSDPPDERRKGNDGVATDDDDDDDGAVTEIPTGDLENLSQDDLSLLMRSSSSENDDDEVESSTENPLAYSDVPGVTSGRSKKLAIIFTCTVCNTRAAKRFSENAYRNGLVLVRCPGCQSLHLIADRLGVFDDSLNWDIESFVKEKQKEDGVKVVTDDNVLELTLSDVIGNSGNDAPAKNTGTQKDITENYDKK